jgi:hypothetical protein
VTAERKEIEWRGGERHTRWRLKAAHRHNESLDLMTMALILLESMGVKDNVGPDYCDLGPAEKLKQEEKKPVYGVIHQPDTEEPFQSCNASVHFPPSLSYRPDSARLSVFARRPSLIQGRQRTTQ